MTQVARGQMLKLLRICRRGGVCLLALVALSGCHSEPNAFSIDGETMGTTYTVKVVGTSAGDKSDVLAAAIDVALTEINQQMSTYLADSELTLFNRSDGLEWTEVSPATAEVVRVAREISTETGGAFDPTVSPWVELWGFGPDPRQNSSPAPEEIAEIQGRIGTHRLESQNQPPALRRLDAGVQLDLSGIAKGYAVDVIAGILESHSVQGYMIEIGGEVRAAGVNASGRHWKIGIEAPTVDQRGIGQVVELRDASLATSGDYRNFFVEDGKRYSHIIDPRTGYPIDHGLVSVSVIEGKCIRADAVATALMVMGPEQGFDFASQHEIAALFWVLNRDGEFEQKMTPSFSELKDGEGVSIP